MTSNQESPTEKGEWSIGHILYGKYEITDPPLTTKRCQIYRAKQVDSPGCTVVVKRLRPDVATDSDARERFKREVDSLQKINDPSVVKIYDYRTENDCYFVTEFANKGSLRDYLATKPKCKLSPIEAIDIGISICHGLEVAAKQEIIHRDIKPENILMFSQSDGKVLAKLADFSIVRIIGKSLTQAGVFYGTLEYAAPERFLGVDADVRSDLFSLAMVFFEMLTGEHLDRALLDKRGEFSPDFFLPEGHTAGIC
jgi:serine/threonine protein kinase